MRRRQNGGYRRRVLVGVLVGLAAAAVAASSVLVFSVIPASARRSATAVQEIGDVHHLEVLVTGQSNAQRGFLLSGDDVFLAAFTDKGVEVSSIVERLRTTMSTTEWAALEAALVPYEAFLGSHGQILALARNERFDEARALALDDGRAARLEFERRIENAHERIEVESARELRDVRRRAEQLAAAVLVLGFAPAGAAFVLGRALRRLAEEEDAAADRRRLAEAQRVAHLGSWEHDFATGRTTWSDELFRILGHEPQAFEPTPQAFVSTTHPEDREAVGAIIGGGLELGPRFTYQCRVVRPDGEERWTEAQGEFVVSEEGAPLAVVGTCLDITDRVEAAEQISRGQAEMRHRAYHDALTGLPNRALLLEQLGEALAAAASVGVVVLDVDGFKRINDSLGHAVGDQLLVRVGERLTNTVRLDDQGARPLDTVARLGGDEFAVLLRGVDEAGARAVVDRVLAECAAPFTLDGRRFTISVSAGIAVGNWRDSGAELVRDADIAMYAAKDAGKARYAVFDPTMRAAVVERLALENELRAVLESGGLAVHYQPIVDARTGAVVKVEALVRWPHAERGLIGPDRFIPLAEETGLIGPLGAWVLGQACTEIARHPGMRVAVNVSARQLDDNSFVHTVAATLDRTGLPADRLVVEVTESALMEQDVVAHAALEALERMGVGLSIDDFGTGYSSLSRLRMLPVGELKIDKSFIDEVDKEGERAPVVAAVIALAHGLGRTVVAEGVETDSQLASLVRLRCDNVQGYLFSRPLPPDELAELLAFPTPFAARLPAGRDPDQADGLDEQVMEAVARFVADGDLDASVRPLLRELTRVTGLDSAYLTGVAVDQGTQEVLVAHNAGDLEIPEGTVTPWADAICHDALTIGPRATADVPHDFSDNDPAAAFGIQSYAMVPVTTTDGLLVGTLCAAGRVAHQVDDRALRLMELFSRLIAEALEGRQAPALDGVRVVIVDDSDMVRRLVHRVLTDGPGIEVVGEAATGAEAVSLCRAQAPDVVLLDLAIAGDDGLALLPLLVDARPAVRVVVLSAGADERRREALEAGASAVVDKRNGIDQLRAVVAAVL